MYNSFHAQQIHLLSLIWLGSSEACGGGTQNLWNQYAITRGHLSACLPVIQQVHQVLGPSNEAEQGPCPKSLTDKQTGNVYPVLEDMTENRGWKGSPRQTLTVSGKAAFLGTMLVDEPSG